MVKQGFEVEKLRLEQEWMRELMEKERLEKEREMERMEKERLIRELEMVRQEQEKVRREKEVDREEEQRWIQERIIEFERLRLVEEQKRLQDEKEEERRREKQLIEDEVLRLEQLLKKEEEVARLEKLLKEEKIRKMQRQEVFTPIQRNDLLRSDNQHGRVGGGRGVEELGREVPPPVEPKGCHDDVVEEQQRILEMILKEKKQEELNQQLIRSICSHDQPAPPRSLVVQQPQPISRQNAWLAEMQKEQNCWEKVQKRKKQPKSENRSTTNLGGKKMGEDAFAAIKKRESEEQLRRGSRNNTHQKVILVPNFTEEISSYDAEQEPLADAPELSLANHRRRVDAISFCFFLFCNKSVHRRRQQGGRHGMTGKSRGAWKGAKEGARAGRHNMSHCIPSFLHIYFTVRPAAVKKPELQLVDRRV